MEYREASILISTSGISRCHTGLPARYSASTATRIRLRARRSGLVFQAMGTIANWKQCVPPEGASTARVPDRLVHKSWTVLGDTRLSRYSGSNGAGRNDLD